MNEWQPIETAPRGGTDILVVCGGDVTTGSWDACRSLWVIAGTVMSLWPVKCGLSLREIERTPHFKPEAVL